MSVISMKQLLEAGVHFGHQTRRWNPKMAPYIYTERNGIYIIDLQKSVGKVDEAYNAVAEIAANGGTILFVGTKKQAQDAIQVEAERCGMCDVDTARIIKREVSDGVIAPGYEPEALEILKSKKNGNYCVIQIDESYVPEPVERKQVFGITFEQGRNELKIDDELLSNVVTANKEIPEAAKMDLAISLITLKYTQSNSVCYVKGGQAIGIGAGQQSRVHCTRLAGQKADNWFLRQAPQVLSLQFVDGIKRADRDNAIDVYIGEEYMDVLADGVWEKTFKVKPPVFTREEKRAWLDRMTDVALGSDAFFPFGDNIERAKKSGVKYIAEPGGSVRDDQVIETCDKYGMAMVFTGIRLFHH